MRQLAQGVDAGACGRRHPQTGRGLRQRTGCGIIDSQNELRDYVLGRLAEHPDISAILLYEGIRAHFRRKPEIRLPSGRSVQEWLHAWKLRNGQLHAYLAVPDAWRGRFMAACGNAAEKIYAAEPALGI